MNSNDRKDGGPAYPRVYLAIAQGENVTLDATHPYDMPEGMSLRDWFAGQYQPLWALVNMHVHELCDVQPCRSPTVMQYQLAIVDLKHEHARLMLEARKQ